MTRMPRFLAVATLAGLLAGAAAPAVRLSAQTPTPAGAPVQVPQARGDAAPPTASGVPAAEAIREALVRKLGRGAEVSVERVDGATPGALYREARPDPSGWFGKPIRFTLVRATGGAELVSATVAATVEHVVARRAIGRGATVTAEDLEAVRGPLADTPVRAVPTLGQVEGGRALRPIAAGAVVLPGFVALPRAVEPGDRVTVVAAVGAVEVTASFVAADGGRPGDVIRCMNPDTRQYVRGRIVEKGLVEVIHER